MADLTDRLLGENFEEAFGDVELNNVYDLAATFRAIRTLHARLRTAKVEGAAAKKLLADNGFGVNSDTLDDALRQCLQAYVSEAGNSKTAVAQLAAAREEIARLKEDSADMDWLDKIGDNGEIVIDGDLEGERVVVSWSAWNPASSSARAAIRAARAGGGR